MSVGTRRRALATGAAWGCTGAAVLGAAGSPRAASARPPAVDRDGRFAFALIGDNPYTEADAQRTADVLRRLDEDALAFVLHVGDLKAGDEPCSDALLERRRRLLQSAAHPLVLLPGDNEWTDCHRTAAGGHDPLERLAALRARFHARPEALGRDAGVRRALALQRQPSAPENVRWRIGDVLFVAVHVVGSDNALGERTGGRAAFEARRRANEAWLDAALQAAWQQPTGALVIAFHANPRFARPGAGFEAFVDALRAIALRFPRPILLLHGDTHRFRVDQPLADAQGTVFPHVTRIECFGHPFSASWVRIAHDPALPHRFAVATRALEPVATP